MGRYLAIDFDGVIHSYTSRYTYPEVIPDPPVDGAFEFLRDAAKKFTLVIFTSRCVDFRARKAIIEWFLHHGLEKSLVDELEITKEKPPCDLYIDDRAFTFQGEFPTIDFVENFRPWNQQHRESEKQ